MLITEICKTGDDCYYYGLRVRWWYEIK
jgi:hypothetical protein